VALIDLGCLIVQKPFYDRCDRCSLLIAQLDHIEIDA